MPTYGEKWRANSSACDTGHVPRSHSSPLLRLDSTGEISSVEHSFQGERTQFGCTPTAEMNGNIVNMKNWVTNRVVGFNGLTSASNLTGKQSKTHFNNTDFNANILDSISDNMKGSLVNTMNSRYPPPNFKQPQCGISGWNYSGQGVGGVNAGAFAVFPCHQFSNSFNNTYSAFGRPGKMDMFSNPAVMASARLWTPGQIMEDHHWRQRPRKYDRSYRGHSPKHHEHVKHEKKTTLPEVVSSKPSDKHIQEEKCSSSVSEVANLSYTCTGSGSIPHPVTSQSKDIVLSSDIDIGVKCSRQVNTDASVSPTFVNCAMSDERANISTDKINVEANISEECSTMKAGSSKENGVSGTAEDFNQMLTVNITDSSECQTRNIRDSRSEKSASVDSDPSKTDSNFQVLFIRKNWKKGRPSASKQRRRKLQKAKTSGSCSEIDSTADSKTAEKGDGQCSSSADDETSSSEENKKTNRCSATVSFILGLSQSPTSPNGSTGSSSFRFSFSDDESDVADGDWDTDFDHVDIEAEFGHCDLLNFLPNSNGVSPSPINFKVHISPVQKGSETQDKTIEDINTSWNVQISLKEDACEKKKKPVKKVHFPEDKDLSVVHPMVAWSYAYKAARRGHWENFVRDRDRFQRRVQDVERVLLPVLDTNHRNAVYLNRFKNTDY